MVGPAEVGDGPVVVVAEVPDAAAADVAHVVGAPLRLVVPVELPAHDGRHGAAVPVLERGVGLAVVLVAVEAVDGGVVRGPGPVVGRRRRRARDVVAARAHELRRPLQDGAVGARRVRGGRRVDVVPRGLLKVEAIRVVGHLKNGYNVPPFFFAFPT